MPPLSAPPRARTLLAALALLAGAGCGPGGPSTELPGALGRDAEPAADAIRRDVAFLASDRLEGRGAGTPGYDSAAAYALRRFTSLGIPARLQPFRARSVLLAHAGQPEGVATSNVIAVRAGSDPALRGQYLVIGAHLDHLGRSPASARDPEAGRAVRNGADDNASGSAVVIELARRFARLPTRRSVVFALFGAEELGLLGSRHFVEEDPVVPLDSVVAMLNFDMVGRMRDDRLIVYGVATADELPGMVERANAADPSGPLRISAQGDGFGASDHSSFYARGLPVLHFFTNVHEDYHRATDDAERLNVAGAVRVADLAERVARELGDRTARLTPRRAAAPVARGSREGAQVYLGSVPDMGAVDVPGVRLSAVRPGSPAEAAGLRAGDVIVEFDGKPVRDLQGYSDALYARKPGEEVKVVVMRGAERVTVAVVLGRRGG